MESESSVKLTKYDIGSYRELFAIAIPLILSYFASTLMILADRIILAQYSLDAMNAASIVGTIAFVLEYFLFNIAMFSEVLVGKLNGAKKYAQAPKPTWQMIWMSLASSSIFLFVAFNGAEIFIPEAYYKLGEPYFRILLYFGCFFVFNAAISAFFVAIGDTKAIVLATIVANIVNVVVDIILVFGIEGYVPEMGIKGAAIGSNCGVFVQSIILFLFFVRRKYRNLYSTHVPKWCWNTMKRCFKIGLPTSIGLTIELSAWAFAFYFMPSVSAFHVTVLVIGHTIFIPLTSISDPLKRAVIAIISNCIGAKQIRHSWKVIKTAYLSHIYIMVAIVAIFIYFAPMIVNGFVEEGTDAVLSAEMLQNSYWIIASVMFFIFIEGFCWITSGYLIANELAIFIMIVTAISAWFTSALPIYILFKYLNWHYLWIWILLAIYPIVNGLIFGYKAYKMLKSR